MSLEPTPPADDEPPARPTIEDAIAAVLMAVLVLITFANVVVRYFTDQSFAWSEEISVFLMIVMTLVGASAAMARQAHIRIEYLVDRSAPPRRRRLLRFAAACCAGFFLLLAALSVRMVWDEYRFEETTPAIGLPSWWFSVWLPLLSLAIAARAVGLWRRAGQP